MKRPWDGNAPQIPKAFHARWTQQGSLAPPTMFISPSTLGFRLGPPVREPETRVWDKQNIAEMLPESTGEGVQKGDRQGKDEKESGPERVACWASHDLGRASELSHVRGRTKASHTMLVLPCLRAAPQTSTPQGDTHPHLPGTEDFLGSGTFSQMQLGQPTLWLSWGTLLHPGLAPVARENLRWDTAGKKPLACIARGS